MRITQIHRQKVYYYLKEFYKRYPYEKFKIFHAIKAFKHRLKLEKKDAWIGVAGDTGSGKTLFCLMFMVLFGRPMDMEKNIAYIPTGNQILEMFNKLKFQSMLVDEAAREMRSVNWQSKAQQGVNVAAMTDRFKNNLVFLNMPRFSEFTKSMRLGNLQFRIVILYRTENYARVIIQRKSRNWRSPDPWGDEDANKRYEKLEKKYKELDNEMILNLERSLPVTVMDFLVPNLEKIIPDITEEYERLKKESRKQVPKGDEKTLDRVAKWQNKYNDLLVKVTKVVYNNTLGLGHMKVSKIDMAEALGLTSGTFDKYLKKEIKVEESKDFRKKEKV